MRLIARRASFTIPELLTVASIFEGSDEVNRMTIKAEVAGLISEAPPSPESLEVAVGAS
jgi:hypothetical protein